MYALLVPVHFVPAKALLPTIQHVDGGHDRTRLAPTASAAGHAGATHEHSVWRAPAATIGKRLDRLRQIGLAVNRLQIVHVSIFTNQAGQSARVDLATRYAR